MTNLPTFDGLTPEDRARRTKRDDDEVKDKDDGQDRDDDKKGPCDVRAVVDAYRAGLCDSDEARGLMGLGKKRASDDDAEADDEDRDDDADDDMDA
jgi:hypothetical protein